MCDIDYLMLYHKWSGSGIYTPWRGLYTKVFNHETCHFNPTYLRVQILKRLTTPSSDIMFLELNLS